MSFNEIAGVGGYIDAPATFYQLGNVSPAPGSAPAASGRLYAGIGGDGVGQHPFWKNQFGSTWDLAHLHEMMILVDGTVTTQKTAVRLPQAGVITNVTCKTNDAVTIGATPWVGDVFLVPAANINTDGGTTSIFTTKPTITNGNMAQNYGAPDLTPVFAAGDWLVGATTQIGTSGTMISISVTARYT